MAESLVYMALIGAAGLVTMTAGSYVFAYAIDRFCSSPHTFEQIFSPVSNRANLYGMSVEERLIVLEHVFSTKKTIQKFDGGNIKQIHTPGEIELTDFKGNTSMPETRGEIETETESGGDRKSGFSSTSTSDLNSHTALHAQEAIPEQATNLCSICLAEFENGDNVMTGTQCSHLYHFSCIMQWMQKGNDHCPFCRNIMMTPQDMHAAALLALGPRRVQELARPNVAVPSVTTSVTSNAIHAGGALPVAAGTHSQQVATSPEIRNIPCVPGGTMQVPSEARLGSSIAGQEESRRQSAMENNFCPEQTA